MNDVQGETTMLSRAGRIPLWLFVIDLGIAFGAGLYESRIVIPDWIDVSLAEPSWNPDAAGLPSLTDGL